MSSLPRITKTQALKIMRDSNPNGCFSAGMVERCNSSEDLWNVLQFIGVKADVVNAVLAGKGSQSKKKTKSVKKSNKKK